MQEYFADVMQQLLALSQRTTLSIEEEVFVVAQQTKITNKMMAMKKACPLLDKNKEMLRYLRDPLRIV